MCEKDYTYNLATCSCDHGKYLASVMHDLIIKCDEILDTTKTFLTKIFLTNFNETNKTCKTKKFYILLTFWLITIALLIAVSIYCCLMKYCAKKKHLLPYSVTNNTFRTRWRLSTILKSSKKKIWSNFFWYVKVCTFSKFIQYTIYWEKSQMLKKIFSDETNGTKNGLFFSFPSSKSSQFSF